jgi:hypothetical protein
MRKFREMFWKEKGRRERRVCSVREREFSVGFYARDQVRDKTAQVNPILQFPMATRHSAHRSANDADAGKRLQVWRQSLQSLGKMDVWDKRV